MDNRYVFLDVVIGDNFLDNVDPASVVLNRVYVRITPILFSQKTANANGGYASAAFDDSRPVIDTISFNTVRTAVALSADPLQGM